MSLTAPPPAVAALPGTALSTAHGLCGPAGAALDRLIGLHPRRIDLSLGRIERLLRRLGHPQRALPPVVHVAGTNGKGSTVALMRAMLEAAGHRTHVYTSPHLVRFTERIVLAEAGDGLPSSDGRAISAPIDGMVLAGLLEEVEAANAGAEITFFEITTAAALLAFAHTPADVLLLEVGLGGRLDATNVVLSPEVAAITPVSLDHQSFLGETLAKIAYEKAGILRPGRTAVIGAQSDTGLAVIEARARRIGARLQVLGRDFRASRKGGVMVHQAADGRVEHLPLPALYGAHQIDNAAVALACLDALEAATAGRRQGSIAVSVAARAGGLARAQWPARMQRVDTGRLAGLLPAGSELWLDGGHNPQGGAILAALLAERAAEAGERPMVLVCGMMAGKDVAGFLRPLAAHATALVALAIPGEENTIPAAEIAAVANRLRVASTTVADGIGAAIAAAAGLAAAREIGTRAPPRVVICGSLHLAGRVLAEEGT